MKIKIKILLLFILTLNIFCITGCAKDYTNSLDNYNKVISKAEKTLIDYYLFIRDYDIDLYFEERKINAEKKVELSPEVKYIISKQIIGSDNDIYSRINIIKALKAYADYLIVLNSGDYSILEKNKDIDYFAKNIEYVANGKTSEIQPYIADKYKSKLSKLISEKVLRGKRNKQLKLFINKTNPQVMTYLNILENEIEQGYQARGENWVWENLFTNMSNYNSCIRLDEASKDPKCLDINEERINELMHIKKLYKDYILIKQSNPIILIKNLKKVQEQLVIYVNSNQNPPYDLLKSLDELKTVLEVVNRVLP